jgi:all-trans-8'-apo-beta-carotenal 15,15'-oxygenase
MSLRLDQILFGAVQEGRTEISPSQGEIPQAISGTYYLNGPGNFRKGDFTYQHWLDGDGLIRALHLRNGKAEHVMRYVRSKKFVDEETEGKPLYRAFGTAFGDDKLRRRMSLETPANVNVCPFANRLLAFGEQALPWELSEDSLETIGEYNFDGKLLEITPFSAHPKIDESNDRLCNFGLKYLLSVTRLCYWEFDADFKCVVEREVDPGLPYSVHDFTLSENYASFYLSPYFLNIGSFIRGGKSIHDSLEWRPEEGNVLLIVPRNSEGEVVRLPLSSQGYCLHLIQSFEDEGTLTIDLLETSEPLYPQYLPLPSLFESVKSCAFVRITIDTASWKLLDTFKEQQEVHLDFPALLPESGTTQDLVWALGMPIKPLGDSKYYDRILCFDWTCGEITDTYHAPEDCFLSGEPSMVAVEGDESAGHLICPMWNSARNESSYLIIDAFDLAAGPIAVLPLPSPSPLGFHSSFVPFSQNQ